MVSEFRLPKIAEGGGTGTVAKVLVKEGDAVRSGETLLEVETEKTVVEVPSSLEGVVREVLVKPGDELEENSLVMRIDSGSDGVRTTSAADSASGTGAAAAPAEMPAAEPEVQAAVALASQTVEKTPDAAGRPGAHIPAAPSVRRLARELGVPLSALAGPGAGGRISADDVRSFARKERQEETPATVLPDFSAFGPVSRERLSQIRRATAEHLGGSWPEVPQVTQYDEADITDLEERRRDYQARVAREGGKLTVTAILVKVVAWALRSQPKFNASLDLGRGEIVLKDYVHIGVAVDTERGLLVPVLRDADRKTIAAIASDLAGLAERARAGRLTRGDMEGGTFTVSNLGGIGGTAFSPIVNAPEVAILGVSRGVTKPHWDGTSFVPRLFLPLSLSYDHRLIDGAEAARFLRRVCEALEDPFLLVLE